MVNYRVVRSEENLEKIQNGIKLACMVYCWVVRSEEYLEYILRSSLIQTNVLSLKPVKTVYPIQAFLLVQCVKGGGRLICELMLDILINRPAYSA